LLFFVIFFAILDVGMVERGIMEIEKKIFIFKINFDFKDNKVAREASTKWLNVFEAVTAKEKPESNFIK